MVAIEHLLDAYRFPGFRPAARVRPLEGELDAVVRPVRKLVLAEKRRWLAVRITTELLPCPGADRQNRYEE